MISLRESSYVLSTSKYKLTLFSVTYGDISSPSEMLDPHLSHSSLLCF